jgi:hypothetical protein
LYPLPSPPRNPYPCEEVRVLDGKGEGKEFLPQGYPWYSLVSIQTRKRHAKDSEASALSTAFSQSFSQFVASNLASDQGRELDEPTRHFTYLLHHVGDNGPSSSRGECWDDEEDLESPTKRRRTSGSHENSADPPDEAAGNSIQPSTNTPHM